MIFLKSLSLYFTETLATKHTLNLLERIYFDENQLTNLTVHGEFNENDVIMFVKNLI
jgi:hypothetical protein